MNNKKDNNCIKRNAESNIKIFRFNPTTDEEPYYEDFGIEIQKGMVVLDVLKTVREKIDPTLTFDYGCRYGRCGMCTININGSPKLACQTTVEKEMVIEPIRNFKIVRDLAVDRSVMENIFFKSKPYLENIYNLEKQESKIEEIKYQVFKNVSQCIGCYACISNCPSYSNNRYEFKGPYIIAEMARYIFDPRNSMDKSSTLMSLDIFNCFQCGKCVDVCPSKIPIPDIIEKMREYISEKEHLPNKLKEFSNKIKEKGYSFEPGFNQKPMARKIGSDKDYRTGKLGVFLGCLINNDKRYQNLGIKCLEVIKEIEKDNQIVVNTDQGCCGLPLFEVGQLQIAEQLSLENIAIIEKSKIKKIISLCPGCSLVMKNKWKSIYRNYYMEDMPFMIVDIVEYLNSNLSRLEFYRENNIMKIAIHEPCHINIGQNLSGRNYEVINNIPNLIIENQDYRSCCGGGGMVWVENYQLSQSVSGKSVNNLIKHGINTIVTSCPSCLKNISRSLKQKHIKNIKAQHIIDIIYDKITKDSERELKMKG